MIAADYAEDEGYDVGFRGRRFPIASGMGVSMSWGSRLRLFGLHAVLIASTIQGLAPDAHSLASPSALGWLRVAMAPGRPEARRGRMPGNDRPIPLDADQDATSVEVAILGEPMAGTALHRRLAEAFGHPFASMGPSRPAVAPGAWSGVREPHRSIAGTDLISCRCRLTC